MVAIDNKSNSSSNLVGVKNNISTDEVDMLFAELFALVNSENNAEHVENQSNIYTFDQSDDNKITLSSQSNNSKTEDLAKSLVQIFYKDIGISETNENELKGQTINLPKNENTFTKSLSNQTFTNGSQSKTNENNQNFIRSNNLEKINNENISVTVSFNPSKKIQSLILDQAPIRIIK